MAAHETNNTAQLADYIENEMHKTIEKKEKETAGSDASPPADENFSLYRDPNEKIRDVYTQINLTGFGKINNLGAALSLLIQIRFTLRFYVSIPSLPLPMYLPLYSE